MPNLERERGGRRLDRRTGTARPLWRRRGRRLLKQSKGNKDVRCTDGAPRAPRKRYAHHFASDNGRLESVMRRLAWTVSTKGLERGQLR